MTVTTFANLLKSLEKERHKIKQNAVLALVVMVFLVLGSVVYVGASERFGDRVSVEFQKSSAGYGYGARGDLSYYLDRYSPTERRWYVNIIVSVSNVSGGSLKKGRKEILLNDIMSSSNFGDTLKPNERAVYRLYKGRGGKGKLLDKLVIIVPPRPHGYGY